MESATLSVSLTDEYFGVKRAAAIKISGPIFDFFAPVDVCSRPDTALMLRLAGKANVHTDETVQVVRKKREHYAEYLAKELAKVIVDSMEADDTRDGFSKAEQAQFNNRGSTP